MRALTKWEGELQCCQPCWWQIVTGDSETIFCFQQLLCLLYQAQPWNCTAFVPETCKELCSFNKAGRGEWVYTERVPWTRWVLHGEAAPASALHRGLGADSSPGEWQLSLPVWYLFIGASWVLKSLLWRDETHARILRWDGSRAQPHLALFISLSLIYSLVFILPEIY